MEQRGSAAEPFSTPTHVELPAARLAAWARRASEIGAVSVLPTQQDTVAA